MKEADAIRAYFGQPGFERFLKLLERQYRSSKDGVRGYVTLKNISDLERSALDAFYQTYSAPVPGEDRRYSLKKFERLLKESRFELSAAELLELMRGGPVLTKQEQALRIEAAWRELIEASIAEKLGEHAHAAPPSTAADLVGWARGLMDESSPGFRTLRLVFHKSPEEAGRCLRHALAALREVASLSASGVRPRPIRLPVLAARVTGDAHALDWKHPLGRLFWWGLTSIHGGPAAGLPEEEPSDPADAPLAHHSQSALLREGYRLGGVADDDLSSQAMLYAPDLFGVREERVLTLRQVERLAAEQLEEMRIARVYMVENPSVFAELIDNDDRRRAHPVIVCGNGQPSTAVLKLLDTLLGRQRETELFYSGDLDPVGLGIAQSLQHRYPVAFRAWHMDAAQYLRYASRGIPMTAAELSRLQDSRCSWDVDLVRVMRERGVKLHQELWADEMKV